jgi:hypothetical protein
MSEFNDPDLRQELGRLAGPYPDENIAFAIWQQRVVQVRRRRVVAWTTAAALSLVVGTVGVSALQSPERHSLVPSKAGESSTEVSISTTADASSTTESTEPESSEVTSLAANTTPNTEAVESSAPETDPASAEPDGGTSTDHVSSSQPPITPHSATHTFSAIGGSITVRQDGDRLTVLSINPAAGFRVERDEHSDTAVEVRFRSDNHESQITVKLEEGVMKHNVSESSDNHQNGESDTSVAGDSSGGDHGDGGGTNG